MVQLNVSVEDEITEVLAKEIQQEIDNEIMLDMLTTTGWTSVKYHYTDQKHAVDVQEWCNEVVTGSANWLRIGSHYAFSRKEHAEWFILRWL